MYPLKLLLLVSLLMPMSPTFGQNDIEFFGTVVDYDSGKPISSGQVKIIDVNDTTFVIWSPIGTRGKYRVVVPYDRCMLIQYVVPGSLARSVLLDTRGIPLGNRQGGFGMMIDSQSIVPLEGVDYGPMVDVVYGTCKYDPEQGNFQYDVAFIQQRSKEVQVVWTAHDKKRKELKLK